jgi:hypothetical protein
MTFYSHPISASTDGPRQLRKSPRDELQTLADTETPAGHQLAVRG